MATVSDDGWRPPSACSTNSCLYVRKADDGFIELMRAGVRENGQKFRSWVGACSPEEWAAHIAAVKAGEYDDLTAS